mgnify:CR=1 FL=1
MTEDAKTEVQQAKDRYEALKEFFDSGDWTHDFQYTSWGSFQHELRKYFLELLETLDVAKEHLDSLISLEKAEITNSEEDLTSEQKTRWAIVNRNTVNYDIDLILNDYANIDARAIPPFLKVSVNKKKFEDWASMAEVNSEDYVSDTKVTRTLRSKMK